MNKNRKHTSTKKAALLLAGLTLAAPHAGSLPEALKGNPFEIAAAEAQGRYNRGRDYRDSDLNRLSWTTQQGQVITTPNDDFFQMRADNGTVYRVMAVGNVSLRSVDRNDRVRVYGRLDGRNIIASNVSRLSGWGGNNNNNNNNRQTIRAEVVSDVSGNRFTIRYNNRNNLVILQGREPRGIRRGQDVQLSGTWRGNVFYADSVQLIGGNNGNWQNQGVQTLQGTVLEDNDRRRFRIRLRDGRNIDVVSNGLAGGRITRGNLVEVRGRWNNNDVFRADSVRILNGNYFPGDNNNNNNQRIDFVGEVTKASRVSNTWYYTVRSNGRDYTVRFNEQFDRGDRVRVRGTWQNGTVVAYDIDNA